MTPPAGRTAPLWLALPLAALGGCRLDQGFPDADVWPLAIVGAAAILLALAGRGFWSGALVGLVGGGVFWGVHISWLTLFLGLVPWAALAGLQAIFFALSGGLMAVVSTRGTSSSRPDPSGRWSGSRAAGGAAGGPRDDHERVPYGRVRLGARPLAVDGPLAELAAWVGFAGLGFVVAFLAATLAQAVREVAVPATGRVAVVAGFAIGALVFPGVARADGGHGTDRRDPG
ncbi:hypothetical protein Q0F99_17805 [Rathayibacter oskolensis]|uniref:hypothetical protein n=1 Tax=Rathayibacter oskolensis TaxID=1891671 RepID=UPI00265E55C2|nr:hypothetical protein [Rathayibacter oskolensis]WKK71289.1 hypothetical protein Q0F99_17805 [Rathayibacter oskolensis]